MPSELDRRYDEVLAELTGPGGRLTIERDERGRAIVGNLPATLPGLFKAFCALHGDAEALVAGDERFSFADLDQISEQLAHGLIARGIGKGDHVGIAMRNCPAWVVSYMATLKAGGIATLINGWWEAHEMEHALALTEPKLIIADDRRARRIAERCDRFQTIGVPVDQPLGEALAELTSAGDAQEPLPEISPDDDATLLFTSGSTGNCKAALSTHRAVTTGTYCYATGLMVLRAILESEGRPPPTPRTLVNVPLFHVTGEVPVMLNSLVIGRCMVMMPKWDAGEALRLIEKECITYFVGVPTMSLELMSHPDRGKYDLSSLRDITAGGAPRPVSHVDRLREEFPGAQPALGYGLTESNAVGAINFWSNYAAKPGSTGRAARPFVELAILGQDDRHLPSGEIGEVGIRTAATIKEYWDAPDATTDLITDDGYVRTGDIGYLDGDGYLFIVDRKKDIIIRGGENISAAEVEAVCYACPKVGEASVFGAPDERLGEVPIAVIHSREGLTEDELQHFLEVRLAKFKVPSRLIFSADPLPRLGTGKIDRQSLKAQYAR
ncbi:class I adenylate-forming enzyme family protein [Sphingomonas sp. URHD0057]|uniref:class I adenylate-forming enzyme family protein n=1 Tax=Sphingomonas sp. URHD0057 TaxID=1380389 RepID=UPI00048E39FB|nr:class I adenylate-forming enzyme family protein [Sphingomonas sp. URHD0057]